MTSPLDPDSDDAREMLADAMRDLLVDMLAEGALEELSTDALKQVLSILQQAAERQTNEGLPVAYEDSLAAHIERRRRQRDIDT